MPWLGFQPNRAVAILSSSWPSYHIIDSLFCFRNSCLCVVFPVTLHKATFFRVNAVCRPATTSKHSLVCVKCWIKTTPRDAWQSSDSIYNLAFSLNDSSRSSIQTERKHEKTKRHRIQNWNVRGFVLSYRRLISFWTRRTWAWRTCSICQLRKTMLPIWPGLLLRRLLVSYARRLGCGAFLFGLFIAEFVLDRIRGPRSW